MEQQKKARESRVLMYRRYRKGELPDVQIKHSDIITPLQALAQVKRHPIKYIFNSFCKLCVLLEASNAVVKTPRFFSIETIPHRPCKHVNKVFLVSGILYI